MDDATKPDVMDKYYDTVINEREISYLPYGDQRFHIPLILWGAVATAAGIVMSEFRLLHKEFAFVCVMVSSILFVRGLIERFVSTRIRLIFDKRDNLLYKETLLGRREVMRFDEMLSISTTSEWGVFWYCLVGKSNRFGKGVRLSNAFKSKKQTPKRKEFENTILIAIENLLQNR